jgi:hypothetical protein
LNFVGFAAGYVGDGANGYQPFNKIFAIITFVSIYDASVER